MNPSGLRIAAFCLIAGLALGAACDANENSNANANRTANGNAAANANATANTNARADRDDDDYDSPDGLLTAQTKLALMADDDVSAFDVDVDTVNGVQTLSGTVATAEAKAAAERVAKGVDGVKSVNNELQVVPEQRAEAVNESDDNIRKAIDEALERADDLADLDVRAQVNAGVVTLNGSVDSVRDKVRVAEAVRGVRGVKRVVTTALEVDEDDAGSNRNAAGNRNSR